MGMISKCLMPHKGVWDIFNENGYKAYFVGGCVRDALLCRAVKDHDIATDALPEEIKRMFPNSYDIGIKFGSVTIRYGGRYYDVTTLRAESGYTDFRHPEKLNFTDDVKLDLKRRDFTVNAMAFSFDEGHIDLFGGVTDLNKKSLKVVGDAKKRFTEDALRMMRAVRFACELGFDIEEHTLDAIERNVKGIRYISKERIYSEFKRAVLGIKPGNLEYLRKTGLGKTIHPAFRHLRFSGIPEERDYILRLAYILKSKENAIDLLEFLRAEKQTIHNILRIYRGMKLPLDGSAYSIRKLISMTDEANAKRVMILRGMETDMYSRILKDNDCTSMACLAVNGLDIIEEGIAKEGIEVRHILMALLEEVIKDPNKNNHQTLISIAREIRKGLKL